MNKELEEFLKNEGYYNLKYIEGKGYCGLREFIFTTGLCCNLTYHCFSGRYCYPKDKSKKAEIALKYWDGKEDPLGPWIKYKGDKGEYNNKNYVL